MTDNHASPADAEIAAVLALTVLEQDSADAGPTERVSEWVRRARGAQTRTWRWG